MERILSDRAPAPVGPYSQAVAHGEWVFVSGQIPLDPDSGDLVDGEIEAQAEQVISNLSAVLEAAGSSLTRVVRATVYVTDLALFARINAVYERHFTGDPRAGAGDGRGRRATPRRRRRDRRHRAALNRRRPGGRRGRPRSERSRDAG